MKDFAKKLRKQQTDAESHLWRYLRDRRIDGVKFRRQHVIEPYIVDFISLESMLIIEIDGSQHIGRSELDKKRTDFLESRGFTVMRFWNNEVLRNTKGVLEVIQQVLSSPSPQPSP